MGSIRWWWSGEPGSSIPLRRVKNRKASRKAETMGNNHWQAVSASAHTEKHTHTSQYLQSPSLFFRKDFSCYRKEPGMPFQYSTVESLSLGSVSFCKVGIEQLKTNVLEGSPSLATVMVPSVPLRQTVGSGKTEAEHLSQKGCVSHRQNSVPRGLSHSLQQLPVVQVTQENLSQMVSKVILFYCRSYF